MYCVGRFCRGTHEAADFKLKLLRPGLPDGVDCFQGDLLYAWYAFERG